MTLAKKRASRDRVFGRRPAKVVIGAAVAAAMMLAPIAANASEAPAEEVGAVEVAAVVDPGDTQPAPVQDVVEEVAVQVEEPAQDVVAETQPVVEEVSQPEPEPEPAADPGVDPAATPTPPASAAAAQMSSGASAEPKVQEGVDRPLVSSGVVESGLGVYFMAIGGNDDGWMLGITGPNGKVIADRFPVTSDVRYEFPVYVTGWYALVMFHDEHGTVYAGEEYINFEAIEQFVAVAPIQDGEFITIERHEAYEYYNTATGDTLLRGVHSIKPWMWVGVRANTSIPVVGGPWLFTYEDAAPEKEMVEAVAPVQDGEFITILPVEGYQYIQLGVGVVLPPGKHSVKPSMGVSVIATSDDIILVGGPWNFSYEDTVTEPEAIVATAPTQAGEMVTIPSIDGVEYYNGKTGETLAAGKHSASPKLVVKVRPTGDNPVTGGPWTFSYEATVPDPDPSPTPDPSPSPDPEPTPGPELKPEEPSVPSKPEAPAKSGSSSDVLATTGSEGTSLALGLGAIALLLFGAGLTMVTRRRGLSQL